MPRRVIVFALLSASCGAIEITTDDGREIVAPDSVEAGGAFAITGTGFDDGGCDTIGCASCAAPGGATDVEITLRQGERAWVLETVDANDDYQIRARLHAPDDVASGEAIIEAGGAEAPVTVLVP